MAVLTCGNAGAEDVSLKKKIKSSVDSVAVTAQPANDAAALSRSEASGPAVEIKSDALAAPQAVSSHSGQVEVDEAEGAEGKGQSKGGMYVSARSGKQPAS